MEWASLAVEQHYITSAWTMFLNTWDLWQEPFHLQTIEMNRLAFLDIQVWDNKLTETPSLIMVMHQNFNTGWRQSRWITEQKTVPKANHLLFHRTQNNTLQLYKLFPWGYCSCHTFNSQKRSLKIDTTEQRRDDVPVGRFGSDTSSPECLTTPCEPGTQHHNEAIKFSSLTASDRSCQIISTFTNLATKCKSCVTVICQIVEEKTKGRRNDCKSPSYVWG